MGDVSAEPSMEEILSSIKRIIAEEGDGGQPRNRRPQRPAPITARQPDRVIDDADDYDDDDHALQGRGADEPILELSDPMPEPEAPRARTRPAPTAAPAPAAAPAESLLSQETAAASRGSLDTLSKLLVKPDAGSDGTLEGLVREMLRPMLRDWLDANLPDLVETLVAREITKITGQGR